MGSSGPSIDPLARVVDGRRQVFFESVMKKLLCVLLSLSLAGCGDDPVSFSGTWSGSFDRVDSSCPFPVSGDLNSLFPMVVTEQPEGVFVVNAANGDVARGEQGDGESISFTATAPEFGDYGSITPYVCTSSATLGFLNDGDNNAKISVFIEFNDCVAPTSVTQISTCAVTYFGNAVRE